MVKKTPGGVAVAKCCRIWVLILSAIERIKVWGWGNDIPFASHPDSGLLVRLTPNRARSLVRERNRAVSRPPWASHRQWPKDFGILVLQPHKNGEFEARPEIIY